MGIFPTHSPELLSALSSKLQFVYLRQLCLVLSGMMRGRMGAAVQSMRMNRADEKRARELASLGSQHDDQLRSAAVRELRAVLVRLHKGVVAMHVERWRTNKKWDVMREGAAMRARLEAEMAPSA